MKQDEQSRRAFMRTAALGGATTALLGLSNESASAQQTTPIKRMSVEERLQMLLDREEIGELIVRYGYSFDMRDWVLCRSCFTDRIEMDFSASIGGGGLKSYAAAEWVALIKPFFTNLKATQHIAAPLRFEIKGDRAGCVSMLHAQHYQPNDKGESVQRMIGYYENFLIRTLRDGWKINKMIQHISWNEGNWQIFDTAAGKP